MSPDFRKFYCTTRVSDGFALVLGYQNTFWPCFILTLNRYDIQYTEQGSKQREKKQRKKRQYFLTALYT